jgi:hypothetical protein
MLFKELNPVERTIFKKVENPAPVKVVLTGSMKEIEITPDEEFDVTFDMDKYCEDNPDFNDAMNGDYTGFDSFLEKNLIA